MQRDPMRRDPNQRDPMRRAMRCLFLLATLAPLLALAQATTPVAPALPEWDTLSAAQREALVAPLRERWNREPGERARMLERAQRWQTMPAGQRERARHGMHRWEGMPPQGRAQARALFHAMRGLDAEQRKAFLATWRQMTPQQRGNWLAAHPAPQRERQAPPARPMQE